MRLSRPSALWPHDLFRCDWRSRAGSVEHLDISESQVVMRSMVLGLAPREIARCEYHRPDWRWVADAAVALAKTGDLSSEGVSRVRRSMDEDTHWALYSFIFEPIIWSGGHALANGQHRLYAMKLAGVARCPVVDA
jgi:hypothetical protein